MKSKIHPIFIIVGLFIFKVALVDNIRNAGGSSRTIASESSHYKGLKPIR